MVSVKNLSVFYNNFRVLNNISFDVKKGDFLHIVGPNGGGKTTLVKAILKSVENKSLSISIKSNKLSYLSQFNNISKLVPITVLEVLESVSNNMNDIDLWLKKFDMISYKFSSFRELSGGEKQRIFIIRSLLLNPEIFILDEPTSSLDPSFRERFLELLFDLNKNKKMTILNVTHDLTDIVKENSRIIYLDREIYFNGSYNEFKKFEHKGHKHD